MRGPNLRTCRSPRPGSAGRRGGGRRRIVGGMSQAEAGGGVRSRRAAEGMVVIVVVVVAVFVEHGYDVVAFVGRSSAIVLLRRQRRSRRLPRGGRGGVNVPHPRPDARGTSLRVRLWQVRASGRRGRSQSQPPRSRPRTPDSARRDWRRRGGGPLALLHGERFIFAQRFFFRGVNESRYRMFFYESITWTGISPHSLLL